MYLYIFEFNTYIYIYTYLYTRIITSMCFTKIVIVDSACGFGTMVHGRMGGMMVGPLAAALRCGGQASQGAEMLESCEQ